MGLFEKSATCNISLSSNLSLWFDNWSQIGSLISILVGPLRPEDHPLSLKDRLANNMWNLSCISYLLPSWLINHISYIPLSKSGSDLMVCNFSKGKFFNSRDLYSSTNPKISLLHPLIGISYGIPYVLKVYPSFFVN